MQRLPTSLAYGALAALTACTYGAPGSLTSSAPGAVTTIEVDRPNWLTESGDMLLGARAIGPTARPTLLDDCRRSATQIGRHARLLFENKRAQLAQSTLAGALTVGFPPPAKE